MDGAPRSGRQTLLGMPGHGPALLVPPCSAAGRGRPQARKGRGARRAQNEVEAVPEAERRQALLLPPGIEGDVVDCARGIAQGEAGGERGGGDERDGGEGEGGRGRGAGCRRGGSGASFRRRHDERTSVSSSCCCCNSRKIRGKGGTSTFCCRRSRFCFCHCRCRCRRLAAAPGRRRGREEAGEEECGGERSYVRHKGRSSRGLLRAADG